MATVNTNINMHSAVKYWLHRTLVRPLWYELNSLLERLKTLVAILSFKCPFYD